MLRCSEPVGIHPTAAFRIVHRHVVGHFSAHTLHEGGNGGGVLAHVRADHHQPLGLVLFVNIIQVRNGLDTGAAPSRPELDDVNLVALEFLNPLPLRPTAYLNFRCRVPDFERCR